MTKSSKITPKILYRRLLKFAQKCQKLVNSLPKTTYNLEYGKQLIKSSASPGANYIEAIEASSKRDFIYRLKVCRKETKESIHWLLLIKTSNKEGREIKKECNELLSESKELIKIFTSSVLTAEKNKKIRSVK